MTRTADYPFHDPPAAPLFEAEEISGETVEGWRSMLQERASRFPGEAGSRLRRAYRYTRHGIDQYRDTFSFRQEVLDDSIGEYIAFVEWLAPYSETEGWVGYFRSHIDEVGAQPVLVYFKQGRVYMSDSTQSPKDIATGAPWPTEG
jgi:hypothetical protein